jgi:predicted permease
VSWSLARRLAARGYQELTFQAIYAYRQGNMASGLPPSELVARARRRVLESKLLVAFVFALISLGSTLILSPSVEQTFGGGMPRGLYVGAVVSALLLLEMVLLWWMGLQILPTFLASGIGTTFETLPVDAATLDRAALIMFLRLFDVQAATILILTPVAIALALGSPLAGLSIVPAVLAVIVFALLLALKASQFFVERVQSSGGGSQKTVARWVFLVAWSIPAFSIYGFLALSGDFLGWLSGLANQGALGTLYLVFSVFPMSFAMLPPYVAGLPITGVNAYDAYGSIVALAGSAGYLFLMLVATGWLSTAPRRLYLTTAPASVDTFARPPTFVRRSRPMSVLVKDLRIASRTPPFALLVILPLLDALAVGVFTFVSTPVTRDVFRIGVAAVSTAALLATFFGPAFFAIEVIGYSYTRALPISPRSLLVGKVMLVTFVYLAAAGVVLGLTAARLFSPVLFAAFAAAELPAIIGAAIVEFGILVLRAERKGLSIVNLYSSAWSAMIVAIPGLLIAGTPLLLFDFLQGASNIEALEAMALASLLALSAALQFLVWIERPRRAA